MNKVPLLLLQRNHDPGSTKSQEKGPSPSFQFEVGTDEIQKKQTIYSIRLILSKNGTKPKTKDFKNSWLSD